jgi:parallel beta-helix repeat protein
MGYRGRSFGVICASVLMTGATGCIVPSSGIRTKNLAQGLMTTTAFPSVPTPIPPSPPASAPAPPAVTSYPAGSHFVDANDGNDANDGLSPATAWKTVSKVNGVRLSPGDAVLFKRGQTFYGALTVNQSGTSANPITFGAYGSLSTRPVISGFETLSHWVAVEPGIFEAACVDCKKTAEVVTVDGTDTPMGRWPNRDAANGGYRSVTSHDGTTSFSDAAMPAGLDWTNGEAVIRKYRWVLDRQTITSQIGTRLNYSSPSPYSAADGFGYFIQNHPDTLDQFGEWYYSPNSKKFRMFFGTNSPDRYTVRVSSVDNLFYILYRNDIVIKDLAFEGAGNSAIYLGSSTGITIENCEFNSSYNGVFGDNWGSNSTGFVLQDSKFDHMNNFGVRLPSEFVGAVIRNNTIRNTGLLPGMGDAYTALGSSGANSAIDGNQIENTGYIGIEFSGSGVTVKNNFVNFFCSVKDDGGGIYTANPTPTTITGDQVEKNIVLNAVGAGMGTDAPNYSSTIGIYLDDNSNGITVANNTTSTMGIAGIFLHNAFNITLESNTALDNARAALLVTNDHADSTTYGLKITNNIFFANSPTELAADFVTLHSDIRTFGVMNHNVYARPLDDDLTFIVQPRGELTPETKLNLAGWQTYSGQDQDSRKSPKTIATTDSIFFKYNNTDSTVTVPLDQDYLGLDGKTYRVSYPIPPHGSVILLKK